MYAFWNSFMFLALVFWLNNDHVNCDEGFFIAFQTDYKGTSSPSIDEWIEFNNTIPSTNEFTACHWIRARYFNKRISVNLWSYCRQDNDDSALECVQLFLQHSLKSAHRDLTMNLQIPFNNSFLNLSLIHI